jgi:CheY-like chemotaxis protein
MRMLRIAICDDLQSEREAVKGFLHSFFAAVPYEYALTEYGCGETIADDYEDGSVDFDLIFLDIFLEGMLGMEAACCAGVLVLQICRLP